MASELKLSGTTARVILQGNDTITSDQTFTFPDSGGRILTADGNTNNDGNGGSSGSAQVVGFQQGTWSPEWTQGATTSYVNTGGFWSRIGNTVFITGRIQGIGGSVNSSQLILGKMPYKQMLGNGAGCISIGMGGQLFGNSFYSALMNGDEAAMGFYGTDGVAKVGNDIATLAAICHFEGFYHTANTDWIPLNGATVS
nr:hypothetical protein [uncultured Mediterranean phage uvMED]